MDSLPNKNMDKTRIKYIKWNIFSQYHFTIQTKKDKISCNGKSVNYKMSSLENYRNNYRSDTIGEMFDKAVDKTLGNKDFMKFAEDKKG